MRMMLVGAGAVGESLLKILKSRDAAGEWLQFVLVGDCDKERAERVAEELGDPARFMPAAIDASDPDRQEHIQVVERLIAKLARPGAQVLQVYNKADLVPATDIPVGQDVVKISAKLGLGMEELLKAIERLVAPSRHPVVLLLPYAQGGLVDTLHKNTTVRRVDYTGDGIEVEAVLDDILYGRLRPYVVKEL